MSREDALEGEDVLVDYEADDDDEDTDENENVNVNVSTEETETGSENRKRKHQPDEGGIQKAAAAAAEVPLGVGGEPMKRNKTTNDNGHDLPVAKARVEMEVGRSGSGSGSNPRLSYNQNNIASSISSHGVYVPPFRRRQLENLAVSEGGELNAQSQSSANANANANADASNNTAVAVAVVLPMKIQRQKWEQLKKAINGTINRLNGKTIKDLIHSLFQNANLIRGKGLMAKSILRAATTSPTYCPVYASLISVVNTKLPEVGELIVTRAILMFRKSYARQDRAITMATANFMGCLFNQGLCHELLCLQILTVLLEGEPTDDSVEVAVQFTKVVGMALNESSPTGIHAIMERFRNLLHDGRIGRRVQYKIEEMMKIRKNRFKEFPALEEDLDLVESEEQITFELGLDDEGLEKEEHLDVFRFDPNWSENENDWIEIRREIIGDDNSDESDDSGGTEEESEEEDDDSDSDDEDDEDGVLVALPEDPSAYSANDKQITEIRDMSETDLINLRRTIYLTIMSSATFEECSHKLSKMDIPIGKEMELINMLIECCSQERTFLRYYGLIAARFCLLHRRWSGAFHEAFIVQYNTIHRLETNKLRNVSKLFSHLLHTDSLSWSCLSAIHLNEDETTSSSRIFLKILIQEMAEAIGIGTLVKRFESDDPETIEWFKEIFPRDNPRKTRYAINFFTSIGLGPLTDGLREYLKNAPKIIMQQAREEAARLKALENENGSDSDTSSVVSSSSSSVSSSSGSSSSYTSSSSGSYASSSTYTSSDESSYSKHRKGRSRSRKSRSKGGSGSGSRRSRRSRSRGRGRSTSSSSYSDRKSISPSPTRTNKRSKRKEPKRSSRSRSNSRSRGDNRSIKGKGRDDSSRSPSLDSLGRTRKRSSKPDVGDRSNTNRNKSISRSRSRSRSASPSRASRFQGGRTNGRGGSEREREREQEKVSKSSRRRRSRSNSKSISSSPDSDKSTKGKGNGRRSGGRDKRPVDRSRSYSRSTSRSRR